MNLNFPDECLLNNLKASWIRAYESDGVCNYKLNVTHTKLLAGTSKFFVVLNKERVSKRRAPESVQRVDADFTNNGFNFKNIQTKEILTVIPYQTSEMSIIINNSPLTRFHSLIIPNINDSLPQCITADALEFSVELLRSFHGNRDFRLGYNSPGAMASVNHLHLHLLEISIDLYIDQVPLKFLGDTDVFRLDETLLTEGVCCLIYPQDSKADIHHKIHLLITFLKHLCHNNTPHNIFITPDRMNNCNGALKIFIFARSTFSSNKDVTQLNIGFCELAGFITVGDEHLFQTIDESTVIAKMKETTGNAYNYVYDYFMNTDE